VTKGWKDLAAPISQVMNSWKYCAFSGCCTNADGTFDRSQESLLNACLPLSLFNRVGVIFNRACIHCQEQLLFAQTHGNETIVCAHQECVSMGAPQNIISFASNASGQIALYCTACTAGLLSPRTVSIPYCLQRVTLLGNHHEPLKPSRSNLENGKVSARSTRPPAKKARKRAPKKVWPLVWPQPDFRILSVLEYLIKEVWSTLEIDLSITKQELLVKAEALTRNDWTRYFACEEQLRFGDNEKEYKAHLRSGGRPSIDRVLPLAQRALFAVCSRRGTKFENNFTL
jgi:hypothetical protein